MLRHHQIVLGFLAATAVWAVVAVLQSDASAYYQICETNQYTEHENCTSHHLLYVAFWYIGYIVNSATAAATVAIAWFTLTLKRSTDRLWEAGERQLSHLKKVSEQELGAYIGIESCEVVSNDWGNTFTVEVRIKNAGQTPAFNVTHCIKAELEVLRGEPLDFAMPDRKPGKLPIAPGFSFALRAPIAIGGVSGTCGIDVGHRTIFVWGRVDYEDVFDKPQHLLFRFRNGDAIRRQVGDTMRTVGWTMLPTDEGNFAT